MDTICTPTDEDRRSSSPVVRPAVTGRDFEAATDLLRTYLAWIEATSGITVFAAQPEFAFELDDLAGAYSSPLSTLFVAEEGAAICGTVAARIDRSGAAEIKRMYVRPESRGRGHAAQLLRAALAWARRAGACRAWLETLPGVMDPAIGLYRREGFRPAAQPPGVDIDGAIVMTLDLRTAPFHGATA